jgi:hypothetical protein
MAQAMNVHLHHDAVNIVQQYSFARVTLAVGWHTIDPRLPDSPACNLK